MPDTTWIQSGSPQAPDRTAKALAWIKAHRDTVTGSLVILAGVCTDEDGSPVNPFDLETRLPVRPITFDV